MRLVLFLFVMANADYAFADKSSANPIPQNLVDLNGELIAILNSQKLSGLGKLFRPDLEEKKAITTYINENPGVVQNKSLPMLRDNARYLMGQIVEVNKNVAFAKYTRFDGHSVQYAMWVRKNKLWYLEGLGWTRAVAISEAIKYGDQATIDNLIK